MLNKFLPGWYLLYTRPVHERKVAIELAKRDIKYFLPTTKTFRKWHDRQKLIESPLFPSYIFVYLDIHENYYASRDIQSVVTFVRFGNEVARVQDSIVANLQLVLNKGSDIEVRDGKFNIGEHVKIRKGSLTGVACEVAEYRNERKVVVRVDILNRTVLATVSSMDIVLV